jgi:hypothetical protein
VDLVINSVNGFHAITEHQWLESISRLITDPQLRRQMGQANHLSAKQYDAKIIGPRLVALINYAVSS